MNQIRPDFSTAYLKFGHRLIGEARQLVLDLWNRNSFAAELKADLSPVSEVDLNCEDLIRARIRAAHPTHGIIGEEYGAEQPEAEFVWTIDPIDGTQNLINRIPTFGTILGLLFQGEPVLGWIDHPVLGEFLYGGSSVGTFRNGSPVKLEDLSGPGFSPNDLIGTNSPATFAHGGHNAVLGKVLGFHPHVRIYYDVYAHSLAIVGSLAAHLEYNLRIWDYSASKALIEGAGGKYMEIGVDRDGIVGSRHHAVFGKPQAVELIAQMING
jgi:fructose-1,6-bisphosphatase/inositol monophosphatase family enzyme